MAVFGQSGYIGVKIVVFGQRWFYSGNMVLFEQNVVFVQSGCIREKVAVLEQKWLFLGKLIEIG